MANPEVDRLIQELSQILNTNREKRSASEAMVQGIQEGQRQAAERRQAEAAAGAQAQDARVSRNDGQSASRLSPSTSRDGRIGIAQRYAYGRSGAKPSDGQPKPVQLEDNAAPYEFLSEREQAAPPMSPADAAILEERKKRMTQNLMLSRGQSGGPLGGAGTAAPEPIDPEVAAALSSAGNPQFPASPPYPTPQPPNMVPPQVQGAPPAGWSPQDYAKLTALSQRYPQ